MTVVSAYTLAEHYKAALERITQVYESSEGAVSTEDLYEMADHALKHLPEPPKPHWSRDPEAKPPTPTSVFQNGQWIDPKAHCSCGSGGYPSPCDRHDPGRVGS